MATATQKKRTTRQGERRIKGGPETPAIAFVVFEDNAGDYRWSILDSRGESLARSSTFATYEAAHTAAGVIRGAAGTSRFEPRGADLPVDRSARQVTRARDNSDARRWRDEGGSVNGEARR